MPLELGIKLRAPSALPSNLDRQSIGEALDRAHVNGDPAPNSSAGLLKGQLAADPFAVACEARDPVLRSRPQPIFEHLIWSIDHMLQVQLECVSQLSQPLATTTPGQPGANHETTIQAATTTQAASASHTSAAATPGNNGRPAARP